MTEKAYIIKHKDTVWDGKKAYLDIAFNITNTEEIQKRLEQRLDMEHILVSCMVEMHKNKANISFDIRENTTELSYCAMDDLAYLADDETDKDKKASLRRDAIEYKPIRDAMSHTSRLTNAAKIRLTATYENIKARIIQLLNNA